MGKRTFSRREMLGYAGHLTVIGSAPMLLNACTKPEFHCEDASGLNEDDAELRSALEYRDRSPHGETKSCASCALAAAVVNGGGGRGGAPLSEGNATPSGSR